MFIPNSEENYIFNSTFRYIYYIFWRREYLILTKVPPKTTKNLFPAYNQSCLSFYFFRWEHNSIRYSF